LSDQIYEHFYRHGNLRQCLASQGITTIGEMAKLTESEVNLLPIKQPKLSTALKAFGKCGAVKNRSSQCYSKFNKFIIYW